MGTKREKSTEDYKKMMSKYRECFEKDFEGTMKDFKEYLDDYPVTARDLWKMVRSDELKGKDFEGTIEEFKNYLVNHKTIVAFQRDHQFDGIGTKIIMYDHNRNYWNAHIKEHISDDKIWSMLDTNIRIVFGRSMEPSCYKYPFNVEHDCESGIQMSREHQILSYYLIYNKSKIDWDAVRKEYDSYPINYFTNRKQIKTTYGKTYETNHKTSGSFDTIYVNIPMVSHGKSRGELLEIIKNNKSSLFNLAMHSIKSTKRFQNSGLSFNYFELDSFCLTSNMELLFIFGIKDKIVKVLEK